MKVEFSESEIWGAQLLVTAPEFKKALKDDMEYASLTHATRAFANLFDIDYEIIDDEYRTTANFLKKDGLVIFRIGESQYPRNRWVEILVSEDNQPTKVCWMDDDGYHLKRKLNPKAMSRIKKRHEEEEHE